MFSKSLFKVFMCVGVCAFLMGMGGHQDLQKYLAPWNWYVPQEAHAGTHGFRGGYGYGGGSGYGYIGYGYGYYGPEGGWADGKWQGTETWPNPGYGSGYGYGYGNKIYTTKVSLRLLQSGSKVVGVLNQNNVYGYANKQGKLVLSYSNPNYTAYDRQFVFQQDGDYRLEGLELSHGEFTGSKITLQKVEQ